MRVDLGKVDENRKSREESINAPVSALLCKLAREPCVNTLTQAAAHFCPQIGSTWLNTVFHFKEVLHKTTLAMDTIYFAFSGANCATLAHRHTGTLAHWHTGTGTLALSHLLEDVISRPSMGLAQCFLGNPRYHNVHEAEGEVCDLSWFSTSWKNP